MNNDGEWIYYLIMVMILSTVGITAYHVGKESMRNKVLHTLSIEARISNTPEELEMIHNKVISLN